MGASLSECHMHNFLCSSWLLPCQPLVSCSAVSSTCLSLHFVSILSLCSAVSSACLLFASSVSLLCCSSACLSLRLISLSSRLSALLFLLLAFLFYLVSLSALLFLLLAFALSIFFLCCFFRLPLSSPRQSRLSLFCCFFACLSLHLSSRRSRSNCCWVTSIRVLHTTWGSLRFRRRRPSILKIRCTTHYMGLAQARPN